MANPETPKKAHGTQGADETSGGEFHDTGASTKETPSSTVTDLRSRAQHMAGRAQEMASDVTERAQDYAERAVRETGTFVRRYPSQSLLACFGVGMLVGFVMSSRR